MLRGAKQAIEREAHGWPSWELSLVLLVLVVVIVLIALFAPPEVKALAIAWIVLP